MPTGTSTTMKKAPATKATATATTAKNAAAKKPARKTTAAKTPAPPTAEATLLHVAPASIRPHPKNPRQRVSVSEEFVDSIRAVGVLEPVVVVADGDGYLIVGGGARRVSGAKKAKVPTIPVLLRPDLDTEAKQIEAMVVENVHREDLTPIEEGKAYQLLLELPGYTQTKVAKGTGRSLATVRERLRLVKLPTSTQAKVTKGQISITDAQAIAEFADEPETMRELERAAGDSWNFKHRLQRAKDARRRAAAKVKLLDRAKAEGVRVVDTYDAGEMVRVDALPDSIAQTHLTCPGHALHVVGDDYTDAKATPVCTTPAAHPELEASDEDREQSQREKEFAVEQAERRRIEADLQSAAAVRRQHLAAVVQDPDETAVLHQLRAEVAKDIDRNRGRFGRALLGLAPDADRSAIDLQCARLKLANLLVLKDLATNQYSDTSLERADGWGPTDWGHDGAKSWRRDLVEVYGYQWSEAEQAQLDAHAAAKAAGAGES